MRNTPPMTMNRTQLSITCIQDGSPVTKEIQDFFNLKNRDIRPFYNSSTGQTVNNAGFVGIVRKGDHLLVSLPKHYMQTSNFNKLSFEDKRRHILTIMQTITAVQNDTAYRYYSKLNDVECDFDMDAYFGIHEYYEAYGLYNDEANTIGEGYKGKISWKDTLRKSKKIIAHNSIIYAPFYVMKKTYNENLITRCMIFAINYVEQLFGGFIPLPDNTRIADRGVDMAILNNLPLVISKLQEARNKIFKDIDIKLVTNLISFLQQVNDSPQNSSKSLKDYTYYSVWECAVEKFLNDHFMGIENDHIQLSKTVLERKNSFSKLKESGYDLVHPSHTLEPDHYYLDRQRSIQYIFDSKYYSNLNDLNHKQLVYQLLFENRAKKTFNALLIPTESGPSTSIHVLINPSWLPKGSESTFSEMKIYLGHLNTIDVLRNLVNA